MKIFKNKILAYVIIGILMALQLSQSITNWCLYAGEDPLLGSQGFNGGSLILCIIMLALLALVAIGIWKNKQTLLLVTGVSILSVLIFILVREYSGSIEWATRSDVNVYRVVCASLSITATFCLIGSFVLAILRAFGLKKDISLINTIFSLCSTGFALVSFIIGCSVLVPGSDITLVVKLHGIYRQLFLILFALLLSFIGQHLRMPKVETENVPPMQNAVTK